MEFQEKSFDEVGGRGWIDGLRVESGRKGNRRGELHSTRRTIQAERPATRRTLEASREMIFASSSPSLFDCEARTLSNWTLRAF